MTRKLHNTLMAAIASSSLLVVGTIASSPVTPEFAATSGTSITITANLLDSLIADGELAANVIDRTEAAPPQQAPAVRHRRQSLAMPFYSFAPRS